MKSASETDQFENLPGGQKLVAVELEIKDVGDVTEQDNVLSDTTLLDSQDEPYPGYNGSNYTVSQCHIFAGEVVMLSPGESSSGCVIFQIPGNATALGFNYQPDEGFGTLGQWKFEASPHGAKSIALKTAANNFKNDEVPLRAAFLNFGAATGTWTDATTNAQAEADAQPLLSALDTFQIKRERQQWPSAARWDIRCLVVQAGPLEGSLLDLSTVSANEIDTWIQGLDLELAGLVTSATLVRGDLHLLAAAPLASQHL